MHTSREQRLHDRVLEAFANAREGYLSNALLGLDHAMAEVVACGVGSKLLRLGVVGVFGLPDAGGALPAWREANKLTFVVGDVDDNTLDQMTVCVRETAPHVSQVQLVSVLCASDLDDHRISRVEAALATACKASGQGVASARVAVRLFPINFVLPHHGLFVLPSVHHTFPLMRFSDQHDISSFPADTRQQLTRIGAELWNVLDEMDVHTDAFAVGGCAQAVAESVVVHQARRRERGSVDATLVVIDRGLDLAAPLSHTTHLLQQLHSLHAPSPTSPLTAFPIPTPPFLFPSPSCTSLSSSPPLPASLLPLPSADALLQLRAQLWQVISDSAALTPPSRPRVGHVTAKELVGLCECICKDTAVLWKCREVVRAAWGAANMLEIRKGSGWEEMGGRESVIAVASSEGGKDGAVGQLCALLKGSVHDKLLTRGRSVSVSCLGLFEAVMSTYHCVFLMSPESPDSADREQICSLLAVLALTHPWHLLARGEEGGEGGKAAAEEDCRLPSQRDSNKDDEGEEAQGEGNRMEAKQQAVLVGVVGDALARRLAAKQRNSEGSDATLEGDVVQQLGLWLDNTCAVALTLAAVRTHLPPEPPSSSPLPAPLLARVCAAVRENKPVRGGTSGGVLRAVEHSVVGSSLFGRLGLAQKTPISRSTRVLVVFVVGGVSPHEVTAMKGALEGEPYEVLVGTSRLLSPTTAALAVTHHVVPSA